MAIGINLYKGIDEEEKKQGWIIETSEGGHKKTKFLCEKITLGLSPAIISRATDKALIKNRDKYLEILVEMVSKDTEFEIKTRMLNNARLKEAAKKTMQGQNFNK